MPSRRRFDIMSGVKIVKADEAGLEAAAGVLASGGVAVVPTDTVYGLAAHPGFPSAVERLYAIKGRDRGKPIALLASDAEGAAKFVGRDAAEVGARHWPGALTIVAHGEGVRVPAHAWARSLIAKCGGALRVTSANASGHGDAADAKRALEEVGVFADIVVDGGPAPGGVASTVARVEGGAVEILREGPVKFLVLASGSPRRAKILRDLGVDFTIMKSDAPEVSYPADPERTVRENALAKGAAAGAGGRGRGHVLSADTIVWFGGRIYGKPRDAEEAKVFLRELSGRVHTVFTGVAYDGDVKIARSDVKFRELSDEAVDRYVAAVNPVDRAGAYDIDESGDLIVESYSGSYENIMGLPVEPLKEWGIVK